jgi:hypothetical protein
MKKRKEMFWSGLSCPSSMVENCQDEIYAEISIHNNKNIYGKILFIGLG